MKQHQLVTRPLLLSLFVLMCGLVFISIPTQIALAQECSTTNKCGKGEGDCDKDSHCSSGLVCPKNQGGNCKEQCMPKGTSGNNLKDYYSGRDCKNSNSNNDSGGNGNGNGNGSGSGSGSGNDNDNGNGNGGGRGNLKVSGSPVGCDGNTPKTGINDTWTLTDRKLKNQKGLYLHCPEGNNEPGTETCTCRSGSGEAYHAIEKSEFEKSNENTNINSLVSKLKGNTIYIFPNSGHETCLGVSGGKIVQKPSGGGGNHNHSVHAGKCPTWQLN